MNTIFSKKFWKYFVITLLVMQLLAVLSVASQYADEFIYHSIPLGTACKFCIILSATLLSASLCYAASISSFISFRNLLQSGTPYFFRMLGVGLIFFFPLAITAYLYDWNVQPRLTAQSAEILWNIKSGSYSETIGPDFNKPVDFKDSSPITSSRETVHLKIKSLENPGEYRVESFKRTINAVCLLLSYLLFATLGYYLRNTSLMKIFGIMAIIIVSIYFLSSATHLTKKYVEHYYHYLR